MNLIESGGIRFFLSSGTGSVNSLAEMHWMISRWVLEVALPPAL
jgi:hypothetical protein